MKEAAEKNGKLLMIGFVRRFGNDMQILNDFKEADFFEIASGEREAPKVQF